MVNTPIDPHVGALTALFIVLVLALVAASILPKIFAGAVHAILEPVALIHRLFGLVRQLTEAFHVSVAEFAIVNALSVVEGPNSRWASFAFLEVTNIVTVVNRLCTVAVLAIKENAALVMVFGLALSVLSGHAALSLGHALIKGALDLGSSGYDLLGSLSVGHATDEAATVLVTIGPLNLSLAVWNQLVRSHRVTTHLARVKCPIRQDMLLDGLWTALNLSATSDDAGVGKRLRDAIQSHVRELLSDPSANQETLDDGLDADD